MAIYKQKKDRAPKGNRFLISITVLGSAGPIRFVVSEGELVAAVIGTALKSYAREGRLPLLGSDFNNFMLYSAHTGTEALSPWKTIGSYGGGRNFMLCKKPESENSLGSTKKKSWTPSMSPSRKGAGSWKSWFQKSLSSKISSH